MVMARGLSRAFKSSRSDQVSKEMQQAQLEKAKGSLPERLSPPPTKPMNLAPSEKRPTETLAPSEKRPTETTEASYKPGYGPEPPSQQDAQRKAMKQAEDARGMAMQNQAKAMMDTGPKMPAAPSAARPPTMSPQGMNRTPVGPQRSAPMSSPPAGMQPRSLGPRGPGMPPGFKKGGAVGSASKRGDGIAQRGKTKGRMI